MVDVDAFKTMLVQRMEQVRQRMDEQLGMIASAEARAALLQEQTELEPTLPEDPDSPGEVAIDPAEEVARTQLMRQAGMQSRPLVAAPAIRPGSNAADELRMELILERSRVVSAKALVNLLVKQKNATEQEILRLNQIESRFIALERQQEVQDAAYHRFSEALETAKHRLSMAPDQLANIAVVEPATMPVVTSNEGVMKKAILAGVIGLGICVGLALLLEFIAAIRA